MAQRRRPVFAEQKIQDTGAGNLQASLDPASEIYKEYIKDRMEASPDRPDDEMHILLEERNARMHSMERILEREKEMGGEDDPVFLKKQRNKRLRRDMIDGPGMRSGMEYAAKTENVEDDYRVYDDRVKQAIAENPSIAVSEADDFFLNYVEQGYYNP